MRTKPTLLRRALTAPSLLALAGLAAACGGPTNADAGDGGSDAALEDVSNDLAIDTPAPMQCPMREPFMTGDRNGATTPLRVPAGQARAGRLAAADLPADPLQLSTAAPGDFVLANERVAMLIEDAGPSDLYDPWGGRPVGVARVLDGRLHEPADFGEAIIAFGRYAVETESVTVLRDGSGGGPAVVRAVGPLRPIPFLGELARAVLPGDYSAVRVALDYELAPGADAVTISATIDSPRTSALRINQVLAGFFQGYRMGSFVPGVGFLEDMSNTTMPFIAFSTEGRTNYAWALPEGMIEPFLQTTGFDGFFVPGITLASCERKTVVLSRMVIGGPGLDPLLTAVARVRGETRREVRGTVTDANGMPAAGVHVHAVRVEGASTVYETRTTTDAMGAFTLHAPMGAALRLTGFRRGDGLAGPVMVAATEGTATLRLPPAGNIRVRVREAAAMGTEGPGLPVRVQVLPVGGTTPVLPGNHGEFRYGNGRTHIAFPTNGEVTLPVAAGRYRVVVSRGFEYDLLEREVDVAAGMTVEVTGALSHIVQTPNVLCGDFHIHTHRSPDSEDTVRGKLAAIAGDGVDLAVRSDHEFVADFEPFIDELGLRPWTRAIPSLELTTFAWGHFGVVPVNPNPMRVNGGNFEWAGRLPPAVFAEVRARPEQPVLIINHPRSGGAIGAYFTASGYDPATNTARRMDYWDNQFSVVEFFNSESFEEVRTTLMPDWFALLNGGRKVFAVGSSDSHHVLTSGPVGYPRTCLRLGTDDPRMATQNAVRDALGRGQSTISGGLYVTAEAAGGTGPGGEVASAGERATVRVTVQAPSWVRADRLEVIVDGRTVETIPINAASADPMNPVVRFRRDVTVPVAAGARGSWAIFVAHGPMGADLAPVYPGQRPFGVTNPIFFRR